MIARIDLSGLRFGKLTAVRAVSWSPSRNKRNNVLIVHNGQRMIAKDYAKEVGKDYSSLLSRLKRTDTIEKVATILKRK